MKINYDKIIETYGEEIVYTLKEEIDSIEENMKYLNSIGFEETDIVDFFECKPFLFCTYPSIFKDNTNKLIKKLGINYIDIILEDINILDEIED